MHQLSVSFTKVLWKRSFRRSDPSAYIKQIPHSWFLNLFALAPDTAVGSGRRNVEGARVYSRQQLVNWSQYSLKRASFIDSGELAFRLTILGPWCEIPQLWLQTQAPPVPPVDATDYTAEYFHPFYLEIKISAYFAQQLLILSASLCISSFQVFDAGWRLSLPSSFFITSSYFLNLSKKKTT